MGPIAALWAREMTARGHEVEVVTGFPHYPPGPFRQQFRPYREELDGVRVLRLPLLYRALECCEKSRRRGDLRPECRRGCRTFP